MSARYAQARNVDLVGNVSHPGRMRNESQVETEVAAVPMIAHAGDDARREREEDVEEDHCADDSHEEK